MNKAFYILITIALLTFIGCGKKPSGKSEGVISFKVSYPKMDKKNFMLDFMPQKMKLKFKDDKYKTSLAAGMGMFKMHFIINPQDEEFSQLVKLIDKKYALTLNGDDILESTSKLPNYSVEHTGETKKILNYVCEKAIITVGNDKNDAFTVYYTDKIEIENPNAGTQFKDIDGVLLEYQYEKYGICMKFVAQDIQFSPVDDSEFEINKEYNSISEAEMNKEMQEIFDSFK
ncbi:MAG: hypothetical protein ACPGSL_08525 [Vicingaceae bacterium]